MNFDELNKKLLEKPGVKKAMNENRLAYEIAELIIDARIKKGMTQVELAKKTGTKQPSIARIERGETSINISFLERISKALGMRLVAPRFEEIEKVDYKYTKEEKPVVNINYWIPSTTPIEYSIFGEGNHEEEKNYIPYKKIIKY